MAARNSFKNLVLCLGLVTLVCGAVLAGVYVLTQEPIAAAAKAKKQQAISAVLPSYETLEEVQANGDAPAYFVARDAQGQIAGYVVNVSAVGFGGPIRMMVGFLPDGTIYNVSVLEHAETPGLGAKCTEDFFSSQFEKFNPAVSTLTVKKDGGDVDAITAATITSRAYCVALQQAVDMVRPLLVSEAPTQDSLAVSADSLVFAADSIAVSQDSLIMTGGQSNE